MPRTLTSNFTTKKNTATGAKPRYLLEIQGGTQMDSLNTLWNSNLIAAWHMDNDWTDSKNSNDGTYSGSGLEFSPLPKLGKYAGYFNGAADVDVGNSAAIQNVTTYSLSVWTKLGFSFGADNAIDWVFSNRVAASYGLALGISDNTTVASAGQISLTNSQAGNNDVLLSTDLYPNDRRWHHLVAVFNGTNGFLYLDGVKLNTGASGMSAPDNSSTNAHLGSSAASSNYFHGLMDEFLFFDDALSDAEVLALYNEQQSYFYSDQVITVGPITTTAKVKRWPNPITSQIIPGDEGVRQSGASVTLHSDTETRANIRQGLQLNIWQWFEDLAEVDLEAIFTGTISDKPIYDFYNFRLTAIDIGKFFDDEIADVLEASTYTNADPDDIDKLLPVVYGENKNHTCLAIIAGASSTLVNDISAGATSIELSDASAFPSSGTVIIGTEDDITYSGKSSNTLTGVANVSLDYSRSTTVLEKVASLKYMVANHPVKTIDNVRILPFGQPIDAAVRLDPADFTATVDDSGIASVTVTDIAGVQKVVDVAVTQQPDFDNQQSQTSPTHLHTTTAVISIKRAATGDGGGPFSNRTNAYDGDDNTKATVSQATLAELQLNFSTTNLGTIQEVRVVIKSSHSAAATSYVKVGITAPQSILLGSTLATRTFVTNLTSWSELRAVAQKGNTEPTSTTMSVYEMFFEIDYTPTIASTAVTVNQSVAAAIAGAAGTEVVVGGNSVADTLGGPLVVDVDGYKDDASGTITGTPNALIERPSHVLQHLIENYSNGGTTINIDVSGSFTDTNNNLPASYKFAFIVSERVQTNRLFNMLALQAFTRFTWSPEGYATLKIIDVTTAPVADKTIDNDVDGLLDERRQLQGSVTLPSIDQIFNNIDIFYNRNPVNGGWFDQKSYGSHASQTDSTSIDDFGTRRRQFFAFAIGDNSTMADAVAVNYKNLYSSSRKVISFVSWLKNFELEVGDIINLTIDQIDVGARLFEVLKINNFLPSRNRGPRLSFDVLDLLWVVFTLTESAFAGDVLTSVDDDAALAESAVAADVVASVDDDAALAESAVAGDVVTSVDDDFPLAESAVAGDAAAIADMFYYDSALHFDSARTFNGPYQNELHYWENTIPTVNATDAVNVVIS
jgi:hypothetical protein